MKHTITFLLLLIPFLLLAQQSNKITGKVLKEDLQGTKLAVDAAQVYWKDGSGLTFSDIEGLFELEITNQQKYFVVSYIGLGQDTVLITDEKYYEITLGEGLELETIEVEYKKKDTEISILNPRLIQSMGEGELAKAACCNLSESFLTNPSVDLSITDAVSGTKQIRMLGLEGPNVLYSQENIPTIRGFSALHGLKFIPGAWVKSIQVSKGTGSVVNGYEGISGQINVELKKADQGEKAHFNAYLNRQSRMEMNVNWRTKVSDKISSSILGHLSTRPSKNDVNKDGFMDQPVDKAYSLTNRWRYVDQKGWRSRLVMESSMIDQIAGQMDYKKDDNTGLWGMESLIQRHAVWAKLGKTFEETPWRSFGIQLKGNYFENQSTFANRSYNTIQRTIYSNFIYQSIIGNVNNTIKVGASFSGDYYEEQLDELDLGRKELVPGVFSEYNYNPSDKLNIILGGRVDYHNLYGLLLTPRMHLRYSPNLETAIRLSAGKARRTANIISDNIGLLATNREIIIQESDLDGAYKLPQTESWNFGTSLMKKMDINQRDFTLTLEFYHTRFINSVIVDRDADSRKILFYEQVKANYSNSFQFQLDHEVFDNFNIRLAYRWLDVQIDYKDQRRVAPLTAKHRYFVNLAYNLESRWDFDYTLNWIGEQRLPDTSTNPEEFQFGNNAPSYFTHNFQVTKHLSPRFNVYLGGENLLSFRQENTIINAENPFDDFFDSSIIWGPINRAVIYLGMRYSWL